VARFGVVADIHAFDEKNHILSDIRSVVGDAFEIASDKDEVETLADCGGVFLHVSDQLTINIIPQLVDRVVRHEDAASRLGIPIDKSIETFANHGLR
jgi:cyanophycinase-like exopeptidase